MTTYRSIRAGVLCVLAIVLTASAAFAQALPSGWATKDLGTVAAPGSATVVNNIWTVTGSGADVWGTADGFRFVYTSLAGDGSIVTQVSTLDNVHAWTKAGIMMRDTLTKDSRHAFLAVTPGKGLTFQRRANTGGTTTVVAGVPGTAPHYLKLTRVGDTFSAHTSLDGITWTAVGRPTTITMGATVYVGFAVTSHVNGALASASFSQSRVTATPAAAVPTPTPVPPAGPVSIRVLHWNAHHGRGTNNVYNLDLLADWIVKMNPDVVSLNEIEKNTSHGNEDQPARYAAMLTAKTGRTWYYHFAQRYGNWTANGQGNVILSRFPIVDTAALALSCDRSAALAVLDVHGRRVTVIATHLQNGDSNSCRVAESKAVVAWAAGFPGPRILTGDWNATQTRTEVASVATTYTDAWPTAKAAGLALDFVGNSRDGATHNYRIDYVFLSKEGGLTLTKAQVVDTRDASGVSPSDHKPLLVTVTLK